MKKYEENRPWGKFERFTENELTTVKIISIKPNEELSLQYHKHRDEFWRIIEGNPLVTIAHVITEAAPGDEFFINKESQHCIKSQEKPVMFLEIAFGRYDEEDIIRLKDKYNRLS